MEKQQKQELGLSVLITHSRYTVYMYKAWFTMKLATQRTQRKIEIDPILHLLRNANASTMEGIHKLKRNAAQCSVLCHRLLCLNTQLHKSQWWNAGIRYPPSQFSCFCCFSIPTFSLHRFLCACAFVIKWRKKIDTHMCIRYQKEKENRHTHAQSLSNPVSVGVYVRTYV